MATSPSSLKSMIEDATSRLPGVEAKRLFGCDGFFADGKIFAMVRKEGRIGLKIPDVEAEKALRAMPGADTWCPDGKTSISHWTLVPPAFHDDPATLSTWVRKARALARAAPPRKATARRAKRATTRGR